MHAEKEPENIPSLKRPSLNKQVQKCSLKQKVQEALPKHLALKGFSYSSAQQICCSYSFCVSIINTQLQNEKKVVEKCDIEEIRLRAGVRKWRVREPAWSFFCVCSCFRNTWTSFKVSKKNFLRGLLFSNVSTDLCETCSSHWGSQQNRVSLVVVKLTVLMKFRPLGFICQRCVV